MLEQAAVGTAIVVSLAQARRLGALVIAPSAQANGCVFGEFGGGTGTSSDPLLVSTAVHLAALQNDSRCWGYVLVQTADISMASAAWSAGIRNDTSPPNNFSGSYDGGGFMIRDLTISNSAADYLGLFGVIGSASSSVTGVNHAGGLVGMGGPVDSLSFHWRL